MLDSTSSFECGACRTSLGADDLFCPQCGIALFEESTTSNSHGVDGRRKRIGGSYWEATDDADDSAIQEITWGANRTGSQKKRRRRTPKKRRTWRFVFLSASVAFAIVVGGIAGRVITETESAIEKVQSQSTPPARIGDQNVRQNDAADEPQTSDLTPGSSDTSVAPSIPTLAQANEPGSEIDAPLLIDPDMPAIESNGSDTSVAQSIPTPVQANKPGSEVDAPLLIDPDMPSIEPTVEPSADGDLSVPVSSGEPVISIQDVEVESDSDAAERTTPGPFETNPASTSATESPELDSEAIVEQQLEDGLTFDTAPAVAAIQSAQSENPALVDDNDPESGGGILGAIRDKGSSLRQSAEGAAFAVGITDPEAEPVTIMIMGVDAREGSPIDIGVRPDALMVLRLDPVAGTCKGLAVPRDSWVELPGYGNSKINHALMVGGIPYQQLVVQNYLGIEIDHYALIDFTGFMKLVDSVGGVTITVPPELASPTVGAGVVRLTGEQALLHARYRGGPDGDFGRIKRQQQIMRGLIDAAGGRDLLTEATSLLSSLSDHVRSDMSIDQLAGFAKQYQSSCGASGLETRQISGDVVYGPLIDSLFNMPLSYVVSDDGIIEDSVAWLRE
ncbi:hypothetical protein BH23CHL5_BH23CHL5_14670 [soil metagenome]